MSVPVRMRIRIRIRSEPGVFAPGPLASLIHFLSCPQLPSTRNGGRRLNAAESVCGRGAWKQSHTSAFAGRKPGCRLSSAPCPCLLEVLGAFPGHRGASSIKLPFGVGLLGSSCPGARSVLRPPFLGTSVRSVSALEIARGCSVFTALLLSGCALSSEALGSRVSPAPPNCVRFLACSVEFQTATVPLGREGRGPRRRGGARVDVFAAAC